MPHEADAKPIAIPPNLLIYAAVIGMFGGLGGYTGSVSHHDNTEVLSVKLEQLERLVSSYRDEVREQTRDLDRRVDKLERFHPEMN